MTKLPLLQIGIPARTVPNPEVKFREPLRIVFFDFDGTITKITNVYGIYAKDMIPETVQPLQLDGMLDNDGTGERKAMLLELFRRLRAEGVAMYVLAEAPIENVVYAFDKWGFLEFFRRAGGVDGAMADEAHSEQYVESKDYNVVNVDGGSEKTTVDLKVRFVRQKLAQLEIDRSHALVVDENGALTTMMLRERVAPVIQLDRGLAVTKRVARGLV